LAIIKSKLGYAEVPMGGAKYVFRRTPDGDFTCNITDERHIACFAELETYEVVGRERSKPPVPPRRNPNQERAERIAKTQVPIPEPEVPAEPELPPPPADEPVAPSPAPEPAQPEPSPAPEVVADPAEPAPSAEPQAQPAEQTNWKQLAKSTLDLGEDPDVHFSSFKSNARAILGDAIRNDTNKAAIVAMLTEVAEGSREATPPKEED
jgi:hypothetical protein